MTSAEPHASAPHSRQITTSATQLKLNRLDPSYRISAVNVGTPTDNSLTIQLYENVFTLVYRYDKWSLFGC